MTSNGTANNSRTRLTGTGPACLLVAVKKIEDNPQHMAVRMAAISPITCEFYHRLGGETAVLIDEGTRYRLMDKPQQ